MKTKKLKFFYLLLLIISSLLLSSCLQEGRYNGILLSKLSEYITNKYTRKTDNSVRTVSSMQSVYTSDYTYSLFSHDTGLINMAYSYGNIYQLDVDKSESDILINFSHGRWFPEDITSDENRGVAVRSHANYIFIQNDYNFKSIT